MPRQAGSARRSPTTFWIGVMVGALLVLGAAALYAVLVVRPAAATCVEELDHSDGGTLTWSFTPWSGFRCGVDA